MTNEWGAWESELEHAHRRERRRGQIELTVEALFLAAAAVMGVLAGVALAAGATTLFIVFCGLTNASVIGGILYRWHFGSWSSSSSGG